MKNWLVRTAAVWLFFALAATPVMAYELIPGGQVVGLEVQNGTVTVIGFSEGSRGKDAGLQEGDVLQAVDGKPVSSIVDVNRALEQAHGSVTLSISRKGKPQSVRVAPELTADGARLGIYLKEGITGIGTVTYYDPETGSFGALGHGVNEPGGKLTKMTGGSVCRAKVASVRRGKAGEPGQLVGALADPTPMGSLTKNTAQGLFGTADGIRGEPLSTAAAQPGEATILCTVSGTQPQEYSVQILKIYPRSDTRNLVLRITDPRLLQTTGGIVQGMSGSPILQDGKLVGAVTHVLVNDPTTGYGIFIENMLDAAA